MTSPKIDPALLHELLEYNPQTGLFVWKTRPLWFFRDTPYGHAARWQNQWNGKHAGKAAFVKPNHLGYKEASILGKSYSGHQVAWAMVYGKWPESELDHIDGQSDCINNLREATRIEQSRNMGVSKRNASGFVGVSWRKDCRKWLARIQGNDGREVCLGLFEKVEDAADARREAEARLGYHSNHGQRPAVARRFSRKRKALVDED